MRRQTIKGRTPGPGRHTLRAIALPVSLAIATTALVSTGTTRATAAEAPAELGSSTRPAASCWEIKEQRPDAPSGTYWLWTPRLEIADQFYCDQETDGGGWVLIGRGREGWNRSDAGMGSTADVRKTVTGPGAFAPRTLSSGVIDGLFNGERADAQQMRLRRALDGSGTTWQETRYAYSSSMPTWSWPAAHGAETPVRGVTFNGVAAAAGSNTVGWVGTQQNISSLYTRINAYTYNGGTWALHKTAALPGASTAGDSYVYHSGGWLNVPFTQVFSRPKLTSSSFTAVPEEGLPEQRHKAVVRSGSMKNPWGVTGRSPQFQDNLDVEVQAFGEDTTTNTMYVGGNFTTIQRNKTGTDATTQPFLAAFNSLTGEWIPTFRPDLDGQVKAIEVLPHGRLAVGGEFSTADDTPHEGFVVLDTTTGNIHHDFTTLLINRVSVETVSVWDMVTHNGWLYLGGKFTHATTPETHEVYSRNIMRLNLDTLTPDRQLTTELNGGAVDLDIHNNRLYAAGTFSTNKGAPAFRALAIDLTTNTQIPWQIHLSYGAGVINSRQNGVVATDTSVWLTGAEHLTAAYDARDLSLKQTWIQISGGDGQTIASNGDTVFAGCHCWNRTYEGATRYGQGSTNYEEISTIGAYDAERATIQRDPEVWDPAFSSRRGDGAWASLVDSRGTLWVGGDLTHAVPHGWTDRRWTGGFVRFEQAGDAVAPPTPTGLSAVTNGTWDALSWDAAAGDGTTYQVFRIGSGQLVTQTSGTAVTVPAGPEGTRYVVRAVDTAGNFSATSQPAPATPGEVAPDLVPDGGHVRPVQLIAPRTSWTYSHGAGTPEGWPTVASLESTGVAPLGWGSNDVVTAFPAAADGTRPLATYYATSFDLPTDAPHKELVVTVRIDDGTAVYLNGKEVLRENLPAGDLTDRTYATTSVPGSTAPDNTRTVRIPVSDLSEGTNTITAETHSNWTKAPSSTFDLEAVLR